MFNKVFITYLNDIKNNNKDSRIFKIYLDGMSDEYLNKTTPERKVIDYIAGMTDDFIISEYKEMIK